jgi:hypothetical protein
MSASIVPNDANVDVRDRNGSVDSDRYLVDARTVHGTRIVVVDSRLGKMLVDVDSTYSVVLIPFPTAYR